MAYKRPCIRLIEDELQSLSDGSPTLLLGDINAKNQISGCRQSNRNGEKLLEYASNIGLMIAAPDDFTYFATKRRFAPNMLDIVLTQKFSTPLVQTPLPELNSDHVPVVITIQSKPHSRSAIPRLTNGKLGWDTFRSELNKNVVIPQFYTSTKDIDKAVNFFNDTIIKAVQSSTYTTR